MLHDLRLSTWDMIKSTVLMLLFACLLLSPEIYKKYKAYEKSNFSIAEVVNTKNV